MIFILKNICGTREYFKEKCDLKGVFLSNGNK